MSDFASASEQVREIERLSHPNEVPQIQMPDLGLTADDHAEAEREFDDIRSHVSEASSEQNFQTIVALLATVKKRERQLAQALYTLAVTTADLNDSHDIIKQWRAHFGYTSDEQGKIACTVS